MWKRTRPPRRISGGVFEGFNGGDRPLRFHPLSPATKQLDYEIELAIVIGQKGKEIPKEKAWDYVAGYCIINDLSARDIQSKEMKKRMVLLSKSLDAMAPMGPYLVTSDEIADPDSLLMELQVKR